MEFSYITIRNVKWCSHLEKSLEILFFYQIQRISIVTYDGIILLLDISSIELKTCTHKKTCNGMFIEALFIVIPNWVLSKWSSTNQLINKLIHPSNWLQLSSKNELPIDTCKGINEHYKHYTTERSQTQNKTDSVCLKY